MSPLKDCCVFGIFTALYLELNFRIYGLVGLLSLNFENLASDPISSDATINKIERLHDRPLRPSETGGHNQFTTLVEAMERLNTYSENMW